MNNGALNIKKGGSMLGNVTAEVTYLIHSNTDVTSLLSGTAIKAVVAYVSDYISKPALKTYLIFETVKSVFDRNSEMLGGSLDWKEKAHILPIFSKPSGVYNGMIWSLCKAVCLSDSIRYAVFNVGKTDMSPMYIQYC
jgi:hypothetical protein